MSDAESEEYARGVIVRIAYTYGMQLADGTFVDSHTITAAYYVDSQGALRAEGSAGRGELDSDIDSTTGGSPVACF